MKPRHLLLGAALLTAAALAIFGDKTPSGDVAEAIERPSAAPRTAATAPASASAQQSAGASAAASGPASAAPAPAGGTAVNAPANGAPPVSRAAAPVLPADGSAPPPAAVAAPSAAGLARTGAAGGASSAILRLIPRAELIGEAGEAGFKSGEGVFLGQNWNPPPPPPTAPPPPPPPSAPPLPFSYIGKSVADGAWEVYLARGDRTYIVQQKTVLDGAYRIDKIAPPALTITYLPLNQVQQLNIGAID